MSITDQCSDFSFKNAIASFLANQKTIVILTLCVFVLNLLREILFPDWQEQEIKKLSAGFGFYIFLTALIAFYVHSQAYIMGAFYQKNNEHLYWNHPNWGLYLRKLGGKSLKLLVIYSIILIGVAVIIGIFLSILVLALDMPIFIKNLITIIFLLISVCSFVIIPCYQVIPLLYDQPVLPYKIAFKQVYAKAGFAMKNMIPLFLGLVLFFVILNILQNTHFFDQNSDLIIVQDTIRYALIYIGAYGMIFFNYTLGMFLTSLYQKSIQKL